MIQEILEITESLKRIHDNCMGLTGKKHPGKLGNAITYGKQSYKALWGGTGVRPGHQQAKTAVQY